jgi:hypothetical protein
MIGLKSNAVSMHYATTVLAIYTYLITRFKYDGNAYVFEQS